VSTWDAITWILAWMGAPLWPFARKLMDIGVLAGLDVFHTEPSDTMVTLCCVSSSLAPTTPAQIRLKRNWLILLPQVTVKEMVLPLAIVSMPAEAATNAVVKAAMGILREEICRREALSAWILALR
jgi:hypothetical protein